MDRAKDHVVPNIAGKKPTYEMWTALEVMYQGSFVQQKMLLENQMRLFQMQKGEEIDPFLFRLQNIRDQLIAMGATPNEGLLVRTALNAITEEWETFVQSIFGKVALPSWADMWGILCQEEIKRITKKQSINGGSGSARVKKEEEEDAALASREEEEGPLQGPVL